MGQLLPAHEVHIPPPAATPAAALAAASPAAIAVATIHRSSEGTKENASDLLVGVSHATAVVLIPGSTTTYTEVNVADASVA